ncbi:MAG: hypothetical protein LKG23_06175 [Nitrospira sp.]|nr:hypothetical protein [Nitrospira sp.]
MFPEKALRGTIIYRYDVLTASLSDFGSVLDREAIRGVNAGAGVGPLGLGMDHVRRVLEKTPRIVGNALATPSQCQGIDPNQQ